MSANPEPRPLVTGDLDLLISRSLDGDLPGEEERELQSLLAADPAARARYDAMARLVGRLEELPDPETPFALSTRVNAQVEADTKGLAASFQKYGFYFRPATLGVIAAGLVTVALVYTLRHPAKPPVTVAPTRPQPARVDDGRVTVYLGDSEKAKGEAAAPAPGAAEAPVEVAVVKEERAPAEAKRQDRAEPVLVASAETARPEDEDRFAPEQDAPALAGSAPAAPAPVGRNAEGARESAVALQKAAAPDSARLRAAAPAVSGRVARSAASVQVVGRAAESLRLSGAGQLDALPGPFEGNYRLELDASGRVADVVRLFGGSGSEPPGLQARLKGLSFAPAGGAPLAGPVDVRVRLP